MRTDQYVYLGIWSGSLAPAEIAAIVGLEPDAASVKASKRLDPPVPRRHRWVVECRDPGIQISDQVERLVERLRPYVDGLKRIAAARKVSIGLQMVRYFNSADGQENIEGWHLELDILAFLVSISASIDSDEHGLDPD